MPTYVAGSLREGVVLSSATRTVAGGRSEHRAEVQRSVIWTYPPQVNVSPDDPDYDAWEAAALAAPEEVERLATLGGSVAQLWKGRVVEDTRPLEAYEPPKR